MKHKNIFWGLIFIFSAIFVLLSQLGFFYGINIVTVVMTVLLGAWLLSSIPRLEYFGILFSLAFLCILYSDVLNLDAITPWPVLAAAMFGGIGLTILFPKKHSKKTEEWHYSENNENVEHMTGTDIRSSITFSGTTKYIDTDRFERGFFKCNFGSLKVFFDHAEIPSGHAEIVVDVSFGDVHLYIPKEWNVNNQITASFGDTKEVHKVRNEGGPDVLIRGSVNFGDCKIFYI